MNADYGLGSPVAPALPPQRRETHGSNLFRTSDRRQGLRNQCGSTKWTPPPWPSVRQAPTPADRRRLLRPVVGPGPRSPKSPAQRLAVPPHPLTLHVVYPPPPFLAPR